MEQRQVFINNMAIRRAIEELKVAEDYSQLCSILEAAFGSNDFDAFDLSLTLRTVGREAGLGHALGENGRTRLLSWIKP